MKTKYLPLLGLALGIGIITAHARGRSFGDALPSFLEKYDLNGDGIIDEEERQAIKDARQAKKDAFIAEWDTDEDGELSKEELEAFRQSVRDAIEAKRVERFNELAGEDGSLSLEEFAAIPGFDNLSPERLEALYARMDADESGDVTVEEFNSRLRPHRTFHHFRPRGWGWGHRWPHRHETEPETEPEP